ncbi:zinc finger BED domain-containing protein RICESLEEPER 2 [Tanacetum coccineum]
MQGTSLTKQERECKLYDEFNKFTYKKGESLHEYYLRFTLLLNDMNIYKMPLEQFQVNTKFLNTLPDEWSKFVTDVKLVKDLHTTNVDQLHAYLQQHERHENEVRLMHELINVEFKVVEGGISSIEFNKEHLIFYLPAITVNENTEVILRNLVAYETTRMKSCDTIQFAEYVDLMCGIIDKPRDVELLRKRNIVEVQNDIDDEEIANLFNGIKNLLRTGDENMDSTRPWLSQGFQDSDPTQDRFCLSKIEIVKSDRDHNSSAFEVLKASRTNPEAGQTSMGRDGQIFMYNPDYLREQFAGLVIQRGLPFNHFDHEQTTRSTYPNDGYGPLLIFVRLYMCVTSTLDEPRTWQMMKAGHFIEKFRLLTRVQTLKLYTSYRNNKYGLEFQDGRLATRSLIGFHASFKDIPKKVQWNDPTMSLRGIINISKRILSSHLHPKDFATFDVLGFWKAKENQFPVLSRMAMDILSVQASSVASESAFSTSGRLLTIRRTRLTPESLEMCMCLKDHLNALERKQDTSPLELPLDVEGVFNVEVQQNEATQLTDQEIALDASSDGSSGEPRHD